MITQQRTLELVDGQFRRNGATHQILAGAMHPFRVHPAQWADRIERIAAMGCNAIDIYIAWNQHQPDERRPATFDGPNDIARFASLVADAGLDLIVRPGPYICAEWDNGGLPAWLTRRPGIRLRSNDPSYQDAVSRWFDVLIPELIPLQATNGGPLVALQVENEYGSYADEHAHMLWLQHQLTSRGISEFIFTADGSTWDMQEAGSIPEVFSAATFGSGAPGAAALMHRRQPDAPLFAAEFWGGWFDHWGEAHHVRTPADAAATIADIVGNGGSVSIYMAHGGTNFGLRSGANHDGMHLQPTVTSYDSDAPIAEDGTVTPKFAEIRSVLRPEAANAPLPAPPRHLPHQHIPVVAGTDMLSALTAFGDGLTSTYPLSFEQLELDAGIVVYTTSATITPDTGPLRVLGLHDRATVLVEGVVVGTLEHSEDSIELPKSLSGAVCIQLIVENLGRINYGPLLGQGKGILGGVLLGRRYVTGWTSHAVPLDRWGLQELRHLRTPGGSQGGGPGIYFGTLNTHEQADGFISLPGFGKGFLWIDGFLLGRYWSRGPQHTLYLPAPLVHDGVVITALELEAAGNSFEITDTPRLGPSEPYVETL